MNTSFPVRRSSHLPEYDYSSAGAYFITVCTREKLPLFGRIVDGNVLLSPVGRVVRDCWLSVGEHPPYAELDVFVVMPNHLHGVLLLGFNSGPRQDGRARQASPLQPERGARPAGPIAGSVGAVVGSFKAAASRRLAQSALLSSGGSLWQRGYHDHVIRDEVALARIRDYIRTNPLRWLLDREHPAPHGVDEFDGWLAGDHRHAGKDPSRQ